MSNLTTYCSECTKNNTYYCNNQRKNSWHCPDYEKKLSEHERHILRIADELADYMSCGKCPIENCYVTEEFCKNRLYNWMMSLKEEVE